DEYQIYEARAHDADLVLLIVAALDNTQLRDYLALTHELGMNALVETHTVEEIERAAAVEAPIVGINVRNLKTLEVDTSHYGTLADQLPDSVVRIAESGVKEEIGRASCRERVEEKVGGGWLERKGDRGG